MVIQDTDALGLITPETPVELASVVIEQTGQIAVATEELAATTREIVWEF